MIKTAHNERPVKRLPPATKCAMALQAIGGRQTIADLSRHFQCSRTTVYEQKNRALQAAAGAFEETEAWFKKPVF
jgi:transposase-like protein